MAADGDGDSALDGGLEAGRASFSFIGADDQVGGGVAALVIGGEGAGHAGVDILDGDGGCVDDGPGGIGHGAEDGAVGGLGSEIGRGGKYGGEQSRHRDELTHRCISPRFRNPFGELLVMLMGEFMQGEIRCQGHAEGHTLSIPGRPQGDVRVGWKTDGAEFGDASERGGLDGLDSLAGAAGGCPGPFVLWGDGCAVFGAVAAGGLAEFAFEGAVEGGFGFVADVGGDVGDGAGGFGEGVGGEVEAPAGEVGHGGLIEVAGEAFGEGGAGEADFGGEVGDGPGVGGAGVE
ncbi:MAG: hypothetical protein RL328_1628 [Acidobacteriota bacterium]